MAGESDRGRRIALIAIVVVTAFVVAVVLGLGGSDDSQDAAATTTAPPTTTEPPTTTAPPTTTTTAVVAPEGDYTAVCAELQSNLAAYAGNPTVSGFQALFENLDFDALVAASNDWLRPSVLTLAGYRDEVLGILGTMDPQDGFAGFDSSALPPDYYAALDRLTAAATQRCTTAPPP